MARRKEPKIPDAILDQLLAGADPKTAFDPNGLLDELKKARAERALNAEMDHHLSNGDAGNSRNGYGKKTVTTENSRIELVIPRDRQSTFDPQLIAKYQRRFPGFDEKIISMYARGMSVREIVGSLWRRGLAGPDQRRHRRRSRSRGAALEGAFGAGGPLFAKLVSPFSNHSNLTSEQQRPVGVMDAEGVPLPAGAKTGSKVLK